MMPNGMEVHTIRSLCATMAAHLTNSQVDMVPANFEAVLLSHIRHLLLQSVPMRVFKVYTGTPNLRRRRRDEQHDDDDDDE